MKVLTGFMGLMIFAISLPSASQTTEDVARVAFFDDVVKASEGDYTCSIPLSLKASFVKTVELGNLRFTNGKYVLSNQNVSGAPVVSQLISQARSYCLTQSSITDQQNAAQSANDAALRAKYDKYVADQKAAAEAAAAARAGSNKPGSAGANSNLQATTAFLKEGQAIRNDYKKEEAALAAAQAKKNGGGADGAPATAAAPSAGAAPAAAAGATATAGSAARTFTEDGRSISIAPDKSVTIPFGEGGTATSFKLDPKTGNMVSKDGTYVLTQDEFAQVKPPCSGDCKTLVDQATANPQTAGDMQAIGGATSGMDAVSKTAAAQTASAAQDFEFRMEAAYSQMYGTACSPVAGTIKGEVTKYVTQITSCGQKQGTADTFCSTIRSPKAMAVQRLMTVGSAILARSSSASEGCSAAQKFSTLAQYGMTAANLACTGLKFACDFSCGAAEAELKTLMTALSAHSTTCTGLLTAQAATIAGSSKSTAEKPIVMRAFGAMRAAISGEIPPTKPTTPAAKVVQCQKYEMDILDMGLQILGTMDAAKQAKACKKALGDDGGGGGGTNTNPISMDEFCKVPGQAANPPCLCRTSPTATGCPGALTTTTTTTTASNGANGGGARTTSSGGSSAMATPGGLSGMQTGTKSTLSNEAKAALGITDDAGLTAAEAEAAAATAGGVGNGDTSAGGSDGGGGSSALAKSPGELAKKANANKKGGVGSGFDDFSLGGFGNIKFGPDGKAVINGRKYTEDEIKKMVERKIASEEFHIQVTTASGKSNWDKVRVRYDENRSSLYP